MTRTSLTGLQSSVVLSQDICFSPVRKPRAPVKRKPISKPTKKPGRPPTFNERGRKRLEEKFPDSDSDESRVPTPKGKRRVAFRGQYIFVTDDDEEEESDGGKSRNASKG